jgi:hypothetical protein
LGLRLEAGGWRLEVDGAERLLHDCCRAYSHQPPASSPQPVFLVI